MSAHPVVTDHGPRFYEALAKHDVPRPPHRKTAWLNFGTKERRCESCRLTPPACACSKEEA